MKKQNKTELQEALQEMQHHFVQGNYPPNSHEHTVFKAAQAYADLPEKIEGMKALTPHFGLDFGEDFEGGMDKMADEILKLLKEEV